MFMEPLTAGVPQMGRFAFCPLFEKKLKQIKKLNATIPRNAKAKCVKMNKLNKSAGIMYCIYKGNIYSQGVIVNSLKK